MFGRVGFGCVQDSLAHRALSNAPHTIIPWLCFSCAKKTSIFMYLKYFSLKNRREQKLEQGYLAWPRSALCTCSVFNPFLLEHSKMFNTLQDLAQNIWSMRELENFWFLPWCIWNLHMIFLPAYEIWALWFLVKSVMKYSSSKICSEAKLCPLSLQVGHAYF